MDERLDDRMVRADGGEIFDAIRSALDGGARTPIAITLATLEYLDALSPSRWNDE